MAGGGGVVDIVWVREQKKKEATSVGVFCQRWVHTDVVYMTNRQAQRLGLCNNVDCWGSFDFVMNSKRK